SNKLRGARMLFSRSSLLTSRFYSLPLTPFAASFKVAKRCVMMSATPPSFATASTEAHLLIERFINL
ncbi:MAG: hypothetical protein ABIU95_13880, partial [Burkholderiales bacterium]